MMGMIPPKRRETKVSSSADRVIGLRHSCFEMRRMADTSVPEWLMPIKNTKVEMYNPHET
jgi:hypothetical protein